MATEDRKKLRSKTAARQIRALADEISASLEIDAPQSAPRRVNDKEMKQVLEDEAIVVWLSQVKAKVGKKKRAVQNSAPAENSIKEETK